MAPLPVAPAPWTLTGSGWTFLLRQPFSTTPVPLPDGAHHPFEQGSLAEQWQSSSFHGGVGMVIIARYETSAVGPYDELIYVPGLFSRKGSDGETTYNPSITNIYVSSPASVMNGRKNWGIPKHHALFSFIPTRASLLLTVSHPTTPPTPFFRALLSPSSLPPLSLPIRTSWLSNPLARHLMKPFSLTLFQPPLESLGSTLASRGAAGVERAVEGEQRETLVGSEGVRGVRPECEGWSRGAWMVSSGEEGWEGMGDGRGFPKARLAFGGFGARSEFVMRFPVAEVLG